MTRTGPDGALWVVDMYRSMIEHPEWLPKEGKAELLPHYRLGDDRGRIYRVLPSGVAARKITRLDKLSTAELIAALDSPNEWQRDKAHMLLVWRADAAALPLLEKMAAESANPRARLHALCLAETPAAIIRALTDSHPGIRENALRLAEKHPTPEIIAAAAQLVNDPDAKVRLQLACTLGEWKDASAGEALARLAVKDCAEPFIAAAVMSSAVPHVRPLTDAVTKASGEPLRIFGPSLTKLAKALGEPAPATVAAAPESPDAPAPPASRAACSEVFSPTAARTPPATTATGCNIAVVSVPPLTPLVRALALRMELAVMPTPPSALPRPARMLMSARPPDTGALPARVPVKASVLLLMLARAVAPPAPSRRPPPPTKSWALAVSMLLATKYSRPAVSSVFSPT